MRCPKCGYTSFDHLDSCKKCGKDLVEFKARYGIKSILFPGQRTPEDSISDAAYESETADAAVAAATGTAAAAAVAETAAETSPASSPDSDDFGFDFMGDSAEDDDLSFDELFEEAPEDEDVDETIEGPKDQTKASSEEDSTDDFSFDLPEEEEALDDDFGFDPTEEDALSDEGDEEEDFSFNDEDDEQSGNKEGPQSPFDLPGSPVTGGAPEYRDNRSAATANSANVSMAEETGDLFAEQVRVSVHEEETEKYILEPVEPASNISETVSAPVDSEPDTGREDSSEASVERPEPLDVRDHSVRPAMGSLPSAVDVAASEVEESRASSKPSLASHLTAFACDFILLCIVGLSFIVAAEAAMATENHGLFPSMETLIDLSVPYFLVLFSLTFGYFTLFHFLAGQTPGKMLSGLRVETNEGEPLSFGHAFLRSVGGLLQLLPVGLGYLVTLTNAERRGWNDRLAGTRVVSLKGSMPE